MPGAEVFDLQSTLSKVLCGLCLQRIRGRKAFAFVNEMSRTLLPLFGRRLSSPQVFFHILPATAKGAQCRRDKGFGIRHSNRSYQNNGFH
jgi:hypothetical protein